MDSAASAVGIASLGIQTCEEILSLLDDWKSGASIIGAYDTLADFRCLLALVVISLRSRHDLDEPKARCVSTCLSGCKVGFLHIVKTLELLPDLRKQDDTPKDSEEVASFKDRAHLAKTEAVLRRVVAHIRERLRPALYALKRTQTDTKIATTSGFEKEPTTRKRRPWNLKPPIDPDQALPCAEEVGLADVPDSKSHEEHHESKPCTPEAGGQQLPQELPATTSGGMMIAFRRRIPFCYLLAALVFIFISSSSAVGLYYSIAQNAMGDGFTTAGFILAVGTLVVTPPAAYHYQNCQCWRSDTESAILEGVV